MVLASWWPTVRVSLWDDGAKPGLWVLWRLCPARFEAVLPGKVRLSLFRGKSLKCTSFSRQGTAPDIDLYPPDQVFPDA